MAQLRDVTNIPKRCKVCQAGVKANEMLLGRCETCVKGDIALGDKFRADWHEIGVVLNLNWKDRLRLLLGWTLVVSVLCKVAGRYRGLETKTKLIFTRSKRQVVAK